MRIDNQMIVTAAAASGSQPAKLATPPVTATASAIDLTSSCIKSPNVPRQLPQKQALRPELAVLTVVVLAAVVLDID